MLIRTFEVVGGRVELGVGGGITVDSVPVREWQECLHKAEPLARAAGSRLVDGLDDRPAPVPPELLAQGVFETILAQHGRPLRLADHLARLARSVRELYGRDLPPDLARPGRRGGSDDERRAAVGGPRARHPVPGRARRVRHAPDPGTAAGDLHARAGDPQRGVVAAQVGRPRRAPAAEELTAPALPYFLDPAGRVAETSRGQPVRAGCGRCLADAARR